ncbi:MAG TPA: toxin TcdB middle/N-terminal domain-containing protein [Polyangiaceae bacterium]|nr:toxin TcdB middle/N-terminal domain-containing protein [Polyangiaceae bacterium]
MRKHKAGAPWAPARAPLVVHAAVLAALCAIAFGARTARADGLGSTRLSLPKGPGSIEGLGRSFEPSLASGTASYGLDLAVPPGAGGFGPKLSLAYDGGGGETELGRGWRLAGAPRVRLRTDDGLPRFDGADTWELEGLGPLAPLVPVAGGFSRPRYEDGSFVRARRGEGGLWEARDKGGITYRFGGEGYEEREGAHVVSALLREALDLHGHAVRYEWATDGGYARLRRVVWNESADDLRHEVLFAYEARPDPLTRFSAGIRQHLAERLATITVQHGSRLVRRYALAYEGGRASRLQSVTMTGTDGVTAAPVLSFGYSELRLRADGQVAAMQSPPGLSPADPNNELVDLDGDGLPDLLVTQAGSYRSYQNHDGVRWQAPRDWAPSDSPSLALSSSDAELADVDGDGALDVLAKSGENAFRYFPGDDGTHFAAPVPLAGALNVPLDGPDVRLADLDGDRRADVVVTTPAGLAVAYNEGGTGWAEPAFVGAVDPAQPLRFSDGHTSLCEMNGDRVADLCSLNPGRLVFWLGRGRGAFEPAREAEGVPPFDPSDPWQLVDLDGDGRADLVHVGVSGVDLALAEGEGAFGAPTRIEDTPTKGPNAAVRFADMNGSGTTDVVWVDVSGPPDKAWQYLELFPEGRGGLLHRIDNGLGKVTTIAYAPASLGAASARGEGRPWSTRMNVAMPVVTRVTVDDSLGDPPLVTDYAYHDGAFDPRERTFAGFGRGLETDRGGEPSTTLVTESTFDTGLAHRVLRGAARATETRDGTGKVFARTTRAYAVRTVASSTGGTAIDYAFAASERVEHVEGTTSPRVTLTEWEHDAWGNVTEERRWGEVVGDDKLAGRDEAITRRTFAQNEGDWLLGRLATEERLDGAGVRVALARLYYDGEPFVGLPLGQLARGDRSRREEWVGPGPDAFELEIATAYNADGQPVETRDGRGGGRLFEWDGRDHTTLLAESVKLGGSTLTERAETDRALGHLLSVTGYAGETTAFRYDALGRLVSVVRPGDSEASPTLRYAYVQGSPLSRVVTEARVWPGRAEVERSEDLVDGLGRKRGTLTADEGGRWVLAGVQLFDARGFARRSLRPRFVPSAESPPLLDDAPGSTLTHDALGRTLTTRSPLGIEARTAFAPFQTSRWDGAQADPQSPYEHTPTVHAVDGLGRLVGASQTLRGKVLALRATYDAAGRLVEKVDPEGHAGRYAYDGRGRRTLARDPDQGEHRFAYDATGNLTEHRRPDGSVRRWSYDLAGRETAQDWDGDGAPEVTKTWGDEPDAGAGPLGAGRLVRVRDPSGGVENEYDERGRVTKTRHAIEGATYEVESAYDDQDREYWHQFPDGSSVRLHRNPRGQLAGYGDHALDITYDGDGLELGRAYATGVTEQQGYDDDRRRTSYAARGPDGAPIVALRWTYDGAGNLTGVVDERPGAGPDHDRTESYAYDNLYRLTDALGASGATRWAYSLSGNLVERTSQDATLNVGALTYGGGAGPHAPTGVAGRRLTYDALGRMASDGERAYAWSAADRLVRVTHASGAAVESVYDGGGVRRVRVERAADGGETRTHFVDPWCEAQGGTLVRYLVHEGRRVVRLAEANGAPAAVAGPTGRPRGAERRTTPSPSLVAAARHAPTLLLAAVLLGVLAFRWRTWPRRWAPAMALVAVAVACGGEPGDAGPPPLREGSVRTLSDADTLLFADQIGSLVETTTGTGAPRGSFAAAPFGASRRDTTAEGRLYAGGERDRGVGLDVMGLRALAPDVGVWTSPDPEALASPERGLDDDFAANNPYAYASQTPLVARDEDGEWVQVAIGAGVGAVLGGGVEAFRQYREHGRVESWGRVAGQAGVGAVSGAVTALAGPQAGLATQAALGAGTGAVTGVAERLIESGGRSVGTVSDVLVDASVGAATAGFGYGITKAAKAAMPAVRRTLGSAAGKAMEQGCAGGTCSCFVAGTLVWTAGGLRPIEQVRVGDVVLARNEETDALAWRDVTRTFERVAESVIALTLRDEAGVVQLFEVTSEHPFRVRGRGWVGAAELAPGQEVHEVEDGAWLRVVRVALVPKRATVYNFEVDGLHTYFVGDLGAWVHNACSSSYLGKRSNKVGKEAEAKLRAYLQDKGVAFKEQVRYDTSDGKRIVDFVARGAVHEAKGGFLETFSGTIKSQVKKDVELLQNGNFKTVTYHFFRSSETNQGGASDTVLEALKAAGIRAKIHNY